MDLSIAKRPMKKDWEMNAFLPENKRHFLPQDKLATKNHSSHFAPNLTLLSFQIRTCADVIQRCRWRPLEIDDRSRWIKTVNSLAIVYKGMGISGVR